MKTAKFFVLIIVSVVMYSCVTNKSFVRNLPFNEYKINLPELSTDSSGVDLLQIFFI